MNKEQYFKKIRERFPELHKNFLYDLNLITLIKCVAFECFISLDIDSSLAKKTIQLMVALSEDKDIYSEEQWK